ncbi:MAG: hypothetical protein LBQ24_05890 [Candidatus Peribacteria bacterium]|jgi:hypothetical protein|nr:hypothetical protein [Candidatus Peribacteria bacterium]
MYPKKSPMKNKTINRDRLHHEFEDLLERLEPDERVIEVFKLNLQKQIEERENNKDLIVTSFKDNLKSLENKIQRFVERI